MACCWRSRPSQVCPIGCEYSNRVPAPHTSNAQTVCALFVTPRPMPNRFVGLIMELNKRGNPGLAQIATRWSLERHRIRKIRRIFGCENAFTYYEFLHLTNISAREVRRHGGAH